MRGTYIFERGHCTTFSFRVIEVRCSFIGQFVDARYATLFWRLIRGDNFAIIGINGGNGISWVFGLLRGVASLPLEVERAFARFGLVVVVWWPPFIGGLHEWVYVGERNAGGALFVCGSLGFLLGEQLFFWYPGLATPRPTFLYVWSICYHQCHLPRGSKFRHQHWFPP